MGKATGFIEYQRVENPLRDENERIGDYDDLHTPLPEQARAEQASRCMNCGVPYCQSDYGCPLHNLIPEWNDLLYRGQLSEALERLLKTAPFPEFTGRVCPGLCEKACMLSNDAATNRDSELYIIEEGFRRGLMRPRIPARRTGRRVAVIGSGPAGLAAADMLNRLGHSVTVFERDDRPGGLLMYGIPNMKLPKRIVRRRIDLMRAEGVRFRLGVEAGPADVAGFDAAVLCGGARRARQLGVQGEDARGVCRAVDYLSEATRALLEAREPSVSAQGRDVIVVGGGDTGNDCVGTCIRQGCRSVTQLEMLPAPPVERAHDNPWPEWPRTLRTDYGQLEAAAVQGADPRVFETTVSRIMTDAAGSVSAVETVHLARDAQGKLVPVPGSERIRPCQLLLVAAGFVGCEAGIAGSFHLRLGARGVPDVAGGAHRLSPGLFVAGDMRTGQSLVVRALADGRAAAEDVDRYLRGK